MMGLSAIVARACWGSDSPILLNLTIPFCTLLIATLLLAVPAFAQFLGSSSIAHREIVFDPLLGRADRDGMFS